MYLSTYRHKLIRKVWIEILRKMPSKIRNEINLKPTYLILIDEMNRIYKFNTINASEKLKEYLDQYQLIENN